MIVKFKDGHKIKFKKFGKIWLAESAILEGTELHGSLDELRELKTKIAGWFAENAPEELHRKYNARLPLWSEVKPLPFKDQIAYREGKIDQFAEYFLGDEDSTRPFYCMVRLEKDGFGWLSCFAYFDWSFKLAVRLCLEERE